MGEEKIKFNTKKIKDFLLHNTDYFSDVTSVDTIEEVFKFKIRNPKNIIFVGEHFLCDIYSNEIWIVELLKKKKYDHRRKGWLIIEATEKVMDCQDVKGKSIFHRFNGYWKIPNI